MTTSSVMVVGEDLSAGWARTVRALLDTPDRRAFHSVTVVEHPQQEDPQVRAALDGLLRRKGKAPVEEVANTIFPAAMARTSSGPAHLGQRYRSIYERVRELRVDNRQGTYFGRLVAYPGPDGPIDQLSVTIDRMAAQLALVEQGRMAGAMSAAYEVTVHDPGDVSTYLATQLPGVDIRLRGFPCLSGLSFQLDEHHVHLLAQYRYEFLFSKGYGNYLGLARLQSYVADQLGLQAGRMTVVAGRVQLDAASRDIRPVVDGMWFTDLYRQ